MNNFLIENSDWEKFKTHFKRLEISAKTVLLNEGELAKNAFYVEKGCLRIFFNNDGNDVTFQFFFEGEWVSSIESFRSNQPSSFSIESIENSVIYSISKEELLQLIEDSPKLKEKVEAFTIDRLIYYQKLFISRIKDNPEKRYTELLKNNPEIILRVPQHYIASFLGITSVSLSRIRNRRTIIS